MNHRYSDIVKIFEEGHKHEFIRKVDEYNERTTKWNFWEYTKEELKLGGISFELAYCMAHAYLTLK